ncbi:phosphoglycerate kinase, partial [Candidatus Altiarchaeota archaeon]
DNPREPLVFVLGGAKVKDSMRIITKALEGSVKNILTGGLLANVFLAAKGYRLGNPSIEFIRGKSLVGQIEIAKGLLEEYPDRIVLPSDVAIDRNGERVEISLSELPQDYRIVDVGSQTVSSYIGHINKAGTVFANGALGIYEIPAFAYATEEIIKAIANADCFSVIGGGDTVAAARDLDVEEKLTHVSTGGKASVDYLAGVRLSAIEALKDSPARA